MNSREIQEGDRFQEIQPTGDAGALWQVISVHEADATHGRRAHLFNVDDPADIHTVSLSKLIDEGHYRYTGSNSESAAAAR